MSDRFFVPAPWRESVVLPEAEGHHLARVLRGSPGDVVAIFDGAGRSATAVVESIRKQTVVLQVREPIHLDTLPRCEIVLAVAVPKGERFRWMIEKVTELGVDRLIPLITRRSVVQPSDHKLHKVEQTVVAACKQSGRNRLLAVEELCPLPELSERLDLATTELLMGTPVESSNSTFARNINYSKATIAAVIGPEGGLTAEEESMLQGWKARPLVLGPHVLRIETAAVAFAATLAAGRIGAGAGDF